MYNQRRAWTRFNCFSPPVMLATFAIEAALLVYTATRQIPAKARAIGIAILFFLATFQLAEYFVCGGLSVDSQTWSKIGYVAITTLPVLGIHLAMVVSGKDFRLFRWLAYTTGLAWVGLFAFGNIFDAYTCGGNYVIFQLRSPVGGMYLFYYYFLLIAGILLSFHLSLEAKKRPKKALQRLILGYLVFLLPTTIVNSMYPDTIQGIPSIMCGFAVLFALILVFGVLPNVDRPKRRSKKH